MYIFQVEVYAVTKQCFALFVVVSHDFTWCSSLVPGFMFFVTLQSNMADPAWRFSSAVGKRAKRVMGGGERVHCLLTVQKGLTIRVPAVY